MDKLKIAYFGGEPLGTPVLDELKQAGIIPSLIVCNPDRPSGRGQKLAAPPTKDWALEHDIPVFQPSTLKDKTQLTLLTETDWDLFVVVAHNHIMPQWLIDLPKYKTINVHPSMLPKLRGANPIRTAILDNLPEQIGVSIMLMDAEMDHGPLLAQLPMPIDPKRWPIAGKNLDEGLAHMGGALLADTITKWCAGDITPNEQNHSEATYTKKMSKADGELSINPDSLPSGNAAAAVLRKIRGYDGWPGTYFLHNNVRIKINEAHIENDILTITNITPAGKKPQPWATYFH